MALNIEGSRGDFTPSPFTDDQLDQIDEIRHADIEAEPDVVRQIIDGTSEQSDFDQGLFLGEKDVASFEPATDLLPEGTALLVTGKGWDREIGARLSGNTVGGASIGSESFEPRDNLDAVTGFVSLVPVSNTEREGFTLDRQAILDNSVLHSPIIQPRAISIEDGTMYVTSENGVRAYDGSGQGTAIHETAIGTSHDIAISGDQMAIASSDTDQVLVLDKVSGEIARAISMIDHGYRLSIGTLPGTERHGFYVFPDQLGVMNELRPEKVAVSSLYGLLTSRADTQKVLTREQTTHVNSVEFLAPDTILSTVFNTAVIAEDGTLENKPGGKVIMTTFNRYGESDQDMLRATLPADDDPDWKVVQSEYPYPLPGNQGTVRRSYYGSKPGESLLIREGTDTDGNGFTDIERVTTLADGLKNPHSVAVVGRQGEDSVTLSVSNTSAGELVYYQLQPSTRNLTRIGGLDFSTLPGLPDSGAQWIHHAVKPVELPDGTVATTVYDGSRKGVHVLNLTRQQRMFVPAAPAAVMYQTQIITR